MFTCKCYVCYIGHTSQHLGIRINQHNPPSFRTHTSDYTERRAVIIQLQSSTVNYWSIRLVHAYTVRQCLPSSRHQKTKCNYPF